MKQKPKRVLLHCLYWFALGLAIVSMFAMSISSNEFIRGNALLFIFFLLFLVYLFFEYMSVWHDIGHPAKSRNIIIIGVPLIPALYAIGQLLIFITKGLVEGATAFTYALYVVLWLTLHILFKAEKDKSKIAEFLRIFAFWIAALYLCLYYLGAVDGFPAQLSGWLSLKEKDNNLVNVAVVIFIAFDKVMAGFYKLVREKEKEKEEAAKP